MKRFYLSGNSWDTNQPIFIHFHEEAESNGTILTGNMFSKICEAYNIDEEKVMEEMICDDYYEFLRIGNGWKVTIKD